MKKSLSKRICALILVCAMLISLSPVFSIPVSASDNGIRWKKSNQQITADLSDRLADTKVEPDYLDTDIVRVSIVLEEKSTIQAGFSTMNIASNAQAMAYNASLLQKQEAIQQTISKAALGGEPLDVVWNLTLVGNIISANVPYGKISQIEQIRGVAGVVLENTYEPSKVETENALLPNQYISTGMTGSNVVWSNGYTGAGSRIAVIDTGTDTDHQSFDNGAFLYALEQNALAAGIDFETYLASLDLLDVEEVAAVLTQLNIYERDSSLTAEDLYLNEKLAFAVNYVDGGDGRLHVSHDYDYQSNHGSHVAGISTANRFIPGENGYLDAMATVSVSGVAPDAQLITMKVFGNAALRDSDYMAAIEDAILLGCDSVNLSLGTVVSGFAFNSYYSELLDFISASDTVVVASAGNEGKWTDMTMFGNPYTDDVNFATLGSPGSYASFLSVASVENDGVVGMIFRVGDLSVMYVENTDYGNAPLASIDTSPNGTGTAYEYVFVDGIGLKADYAGMDLEGKVVFCSRGETNFADKANIAVSLGAAAVIVYNNQSGGFGMNLTGYNYSNPCISIMQEEADYIRSISTQQTTASGTVCYTGTIEIFASPQAGVFHSAYYTMSDFSSWGIPGDLSIKPEITAPGGLVYSVYGSTPELYGTDQYGLMSGTSMAAPQVAGMVALIAQYLRESGLAEQTGISPRVMAQSLLMSTSVPLVDESGNYYSILQQGGGLARVDLATLAGSFIMVTGQDDGKVKAELGDDPMRTGVYEFSFVINNLTDTAQDYALSAQLFRQGVFDPGERYTGSAYGFQVLDTVTEALPSNAVFAADGMIAIDLTAHDLNGDGMTNAEDADYLLEYLLGNKDTLYGNADVNADGTVTSYDAHYLLSALESSSTVTVPAGGSITVSVQLTLTDGAKAELDALFADGAFVQGFVYIEQITEDPSAATNHSIPALAFYGNWTDPNMFDRGTYVEMMHGISDLIPYLYQVIGNGNALTINYGDGNEYYFGGNPLLMDDVYLAERNSFNSLDDSFLQAQYYTLLRNAGAARVQVVDKHTGEVYFTADQGEIYPAFFNSSYNQWENSQLAATMFWDGTDQNGDPLPEGTVIEVIMTAAPEYYRNEDGTYDYDALGYGASLVTQMTIDNTAPQIFDVAMSETDEWTLNITARDNQYIAAAILMNKTGTIALASANPNQMTADTQVDIAMDLSGVTGKTFLLAVYDYAYNVEVYEIELDLPEIDRPYFTVVDYENSIYYGLNTDGSSVALGVSDRGLIMAAEFVDGYVFEVCNSTDFYVASDDDLNSFQYINDLDPYGQFAITNFVDFAYNYADGQLYGLFYSELNSEWYPYLCTIDMFTGELTVVQEMPVDVNNMAIDGEGNFYSVVYGTPSLYRYNVSDGAVVNLTYIGEISYYSTSTFNSLAWDHNTDTLYWAYPNTLLQIDPETAEPTFLSYYMFNMVGLYIRPEQYTGEMFTPTDEVMELQLNHYDTRVLVGNTTTLTARILPWNVTDGSVTWSSEDASIATVDEKGRITGVSPGTTVITASSSLDPSVSASCTVEVITLEKTLNGLIWDVDGKIWWSEFTVGDLPNYYKLSDAPVEEYLAATAFTPDGKLYAASTDLSTGFLSSSLFTVDPETFEITKIGDSEYGYSDIAYAPNLNGGSIMGTYGTSLMAVDPNTGEMYGFYTMFLYGLCAIAYAGSDRYQEWGFDTYIDWFFLIDTQGFVYLMGFLADDAGNLYYLEHPATTEGVFTVVNYATDVIYFSSAHFDGEFVYWSVYSEMTDVSTLFAIDTVGSRKAYNMGNFGAGVWPAGGLMELDNPTAGMGLDSYEATPEPKSADSLGAPVPERLAVGKADVPETKTEPETDPMSAGQKDEETSRVTIQITPADIASNGIVNLEYDATVMRLSEVTGHTEAFAYTTANGSVTLAFAEAQTMAADTVIATLVFTVVPGSDYSFTITHGELNDGYSDLVETITIHDYVDGECRNCGEKDPEALTIGDVNGDSVINYLDAMMIAQYYVGDIGADDLNLLAADVNADGVVNYLDAMMIAQYYVGDIDSFPAEG